MAKNVRRKKWYYEDNEVWDEGKREKARQKARIEGRGPRRFYLKQDTSTRVTFLDSPRFAVWEHEHVEEDKTRLHFTCVKDFDPDGCVCCEENMKRYFLLIATIINHTKWTDRDGNIHKNQKELFCVKTKMHDIWKKQVQKREDLRGCTYEVTRSDYSKAPVSGDSFEFEKRRSEEILVKMVPKSYIREAAKNKVSTKKAVRDFLEPFDYPKVFAYKKAEEIRKALGIAAPVGAEDEEDETEYEDEERDLETEDEDEPNEDESLFPSEGDEDEESEEQKLEEEGEPEEEEERPKRTARTRGKKPAGKKTNKASRSDKQRKRTRASEADDLEELTGEDD